MKPLFVFLLFLFSSIVSSSQNITAKIIDQNTKNPIPFAAIKTDEFKGGE